MGKDKDQFQICNASHFGYRGDKYAGGKALCLGRRIRPSDNVIAHRYLPCGMRVKLVNLRNGNVTIARVGDSGPFGATYRRNPKRWRIKIRPSPSYRYRGCVDLAPRVKKSLRHNGFEPVFIQRLDPLIKLSPPDIPNIIKNED